MTSRSFADLLSSQNDHVELLTFGKSSNEWKGKGT